MSGEDPPTGRLKRLSDLVFAIFIHALFVLIASLGGLVINAMVQAWRSGEAGLGEAIGFGFFGFVMMTIGVGFFYVAYVGAPRFLGGLEGRRKKFRDRPWLDNRQWRARRVVHTTKYTAWFMWVWCVVWWAILGLLWSVNKDLIMAELQGPWDQAIPVAIPFIAGMIGLVIAISMTWRRYRSGDSVLIIETLPGYLGERFRGEVQARLKDRLNEPVGVTLICGSLRSKRSRSTGGGTRTVWITDELWSKSHDLHPTQTTFDRGRVRIPITFELPADLPESGHILDDPQIVWNVKISPGSVLDRAVAGEFHVPVFARRDGA